MTVYDIFTESSLDGFDGAGLFGRLERPYAPGEVIDSRNVEEFKASEDLESGLVKILVEALRSIYGRAAIRKPAPAEVNSPLRYWKA